MHTYVDRLAFRISGISGLQQCGATLRTPAYMQRGMQMREWRHPEAPPWNWINWLHVITANLNSMNLFIYQHIDTDASVNALQYIERYKISVGCLMSWLWTRFKKKKYFSDTWWTFSSGAEIFF